MEETYWVIKHVIRPDVPIVAFLRHLASSDSLPITGAVLQGRLLIDLLLAGVHAPLSVTCQISLSPPARPPLTPAIRMRGAVMGGEQGREGGGGGFERHAIEGARMNEGDTETEKARESDWAAGWRRIALTGLSAECRGRKGTASRRRLWPAFT